MTNWQLTPYTAFMWVTTLLSAGLALYMWRRRPARGATELALRLSEKRHRTLFQTMGQDALAGRYAGPNLP